MYRYIAYRRLSIMHSFSTTSTNIAINDIPLKTRFFGQHFCRRHCRSVFNHYNVMGRKHEFGAITQHKDRYAVQGHSRSLMGTNRNKNSICNFLLVVNNTKVHPLPRFFQVIADYWSFFVLSRGGYLRLTHSFSMNP